MHLVHAPVSNANVALAEVPIRVDRVQLSKRLWRVTATDGTELGFELARPLKNGETVFETTSKRYVVYQEPEAVLEIALDLPSPVVAGVAWSIGNLHLELMAEPTRLLTPDDKAARQLLDRIKIFYRETTAVFRPGHFSRGQSVTGVTQELGPSHRH
jgi:urease accessory protein